MKGLIINLTKHTRSYDENTKMRVKEIKEDLNKWRDIAYSWPGRHCKDVN